MQQKTSVYCGSLIELCTPKIWSQPPRLCNGVLKKLKKHRDSMIKYTKIGNCEVCRNLIIWKCGHFKKWIHFRGN